MKQEIKHKDAAPSAAAYSAGVVMDGWLYVAGQGPLEVKTGKILDGDIEAQTRLVMERIGSILEGAGCTFDDVVKCTCHLSNIDDFNAFNKVYGEFFKGIRPARTTVQSVMWGGIKVEVDAIAKVPNSSRG